jgi:hypothetical protein
MFISRLILILSLIVIVISPSLAQGLFMRWVSTYNGPGFATNAAVAIAVDGSDNVYVTGYSNNGYVTWDDYATIKYLPNGDTAWVRRYNGPVNFDDHATALAVNDSGNVYVTGNSQGSGTSDDYATVKYKPNGDTAWVRRYNGLGNGNDIAQALAVTDSGNVYVTGRSAGAGTIDDYATIKYKPNGDTAWVRRYNGPGNGNDGAAALAVDAGGSVYVTGYSWGGTSMNYATVKYKPNGDTAWLRRYNGPANGGSATALAVDASGNVYVTGSSIGSGFYPDYATIKYAPNGDTAWVRRYDGPGSGSDVAAALAIDASGNVYVTGYSGFYPNYDYATVKYKPNGDTAWVRRYNGPGNDWDEATALAVDAAGDVFVTGYSNTGGNNDYLTLVYDPDGLLVSFDFYDSPGNLIDQANAIAVGAPLDVYVTGSSHSAYYTTIKYAVLPLSIMAFSPVNLIVTDPSGDSIGVSFNTIQDGSSYTVANDSVFIPSPKVGDYRIRVVKDPLDLSGDPDYSIEARIDGTADNLLAANMPVPGTGESQFYVITNPGFVTSCLAKPGDANASGSYTLSDVIATVNYIFNKPGCTTRPYCWLTDMLCRGDWDGSTTVSLSDVIRAVNFIFNKPGGPWNALPSGVCCL